MFTIADVIESERIYGRMPRHRDGRIKAPHEQTRQEFDRVIECAQWLNRRSSERRESVREGEINRRQELRVEFAAGDLVKLDLLFAA